MRTARPALNPAPTTTTGDFWASQTLGACAPFAATAERASKPRTTTVMSPRITPYRIPLNERGPPGWAALAVRSIRWRLGCAVDRDRHGDRSRSHDRPEQQQCLVRVRRRDGVRVGHVQRDRRVRRYRAGGNAGHG